MENLLNVFSLSDSDFHTLIIIFYRQRKNYTNLCRKNRTESDSHYNFKIAKNNTQKGFIKIIFLDHFLLLTERAN